MYVDFPWLVANGFSQPSDNQTRTNLIINITQKWLERMTSRIFEPYNWTKDIDGSITKIFTPNPIQTVNSLVIYKQTVTIVGQPDGHGIPDRFQLAGVDKLYTERGIVNYPILSDYSSPVVEGRTLPISSTQGYTARVYNKQAPQHPEDTFFIQLDFNVPSGESIGFLDATLGYLENGETPALIQYWMGRMVQWQYTDPAGFREARNGRGIVQEMTDGHSYMLSQKAANSNVTGDQELDDILQLYRRKLGTVTSKLI